MQRSEGSSGRAWLRARDKSKSRDGRAWLQLAHVCVRAQGNLSVAIKHLERVLKLSDSMKEFTGDADAYGSIADIYTDLGEFEKAAVFYDKYIQRMQEDSGVV